MNTIKYIILGLPALLYTQMVVYADKHNPAQGTGGAAGENPTLGTSGSGNTADVKLKNPLKSEADSIPELLELIIQNLVIPIGGVIVVFMIIYTGFLFVIAQGNPEKIKKAKESLLYTVIGAAIILGAFAISVIIRTTLGEITTAIQ